MIKKVHAESLLPEEAKAVVWRIFGEGESPFSGLSPYELIEPIIRKEKYVPSGKQNRALLEIRGWFESYGDRHWLKSEMGEQVAVLILEGMKSERSESAVWAVGSIEPDLAARIIRAGWRRQEFDSFVDAAFKALQKLCDRNKVLDAAHLSNQNSNDGKVPTNAVVRPGWLANFQHLDSHGFELAYEGLQRTAGNLIDLIFDMMPEEFESLLGRLGHPVMQARAANRVIGRTRLKQHRKTLQWINPTACDAVVALAIVHTLNTINSLDEDLRYSERSDTEHYNWSTELLHPLDDLDSAAASLITGMIVRLADFEPLRCTRWVGELLGIAPTIINRADRNEIPKRIKQLEKACTELLGRLFRESWSEELKDELCNGLQLTGRWTWSRHVASIAWEIRDVKPERAAEVAMAALHEGERQIAAELRERRLFLHWNDWEYREWIDNLGAALTLSSDELDLPKWISARCRALPLSVWDAEENHEVFHCAERAAQTWFLVAFSAIPYLEALGRNVDPTEVEDLAEMCWNHFDFASLYVRSQPETSFVSEYVARFAVAYGEPSDAWILKQARHRGAGPRALWALIHQRDQKIARDGVTTGQYDQTITSELLRIAAGRFRNEGTFDLEELRFWGQLWLLLGAIDESEQTAIEINSFPENLRVRTDNLLVLQLFALVASQRRLDAEIEDVAMSLYRQLWPGSYTPAEEREDRVEIEERFGHLQHMAI